MKNFSIIFIVYIFFIGGIIFVSYRKHLLIILISLEFIVLNLFYLINMYFIYMNYQNYFSVIYLIFSVCEGVLGLSILVSLIRSHGNDYFNRFGIL